MEAQVCSNTFRDKNVDFSALKVYLAIHAGNMSVLLRENVRTTGNHFSVWHRIYQYLYYKLKIYSGKKQFRNLEWSYKKVLGLVLTAPTPSRDY